MKFSSRALVGVVGCLLLALPAWCQDVVPKKTPTAKAVTKTDAKLLGTWKLTAIKRGDEAQTLSPEHTTVKHVTAGSFAVFTFDKTGKVVRSFGGKAGMQGDKYVETIEYVQLDSMKPLLHRELAFECKLTEGVWHHRKATKAGEMLDESWERVQD